MLDRPGFFLKRMPLKKAQGKLLQQIVLSRQLGLLDENSAIRAIIM